MSVLEKIVLTFAEYSIVTHSDLTEIVLSMHSRMETATTELNWTITQLHILVGELRELGNSVCGAMSVTINSP